VRDVSDSTDIDLPVSYRHGSYLRWTHGGLTRDDFWAEGVELGDVDGSLLYGKTSVGGSSSCRCGIIDRSRHGDWGCCRFCAGGVRLWWLFGLIGCLVVVRRSLL
jgi:hypothetical protein